MKLNKVMHDNELIAQYQEFFTTKQIILRVR